MVITASFWVLLAAWSIKVYILYSVRSHLSSCHRVSHNSQNESTQDLCQQHHWCKPKMIHAGGSGLRSGFRDGMHLGHWTPHGLFYHPCPIVGIFCSPLTLPLWYTCASYTFQYLLNMPDLASLLTIIGTSRKASHQCSLALHCYKSFTALLQQHMLVENRISFFIYLVIWQNAAA